MDVLVFPSRWQEPFGLVPLEALAAGVTVVAYRSGAVPELLSGCPYAVVVPQGDIQALAEGVNELVHNRTRFSHAEMHAWVAERYDVRRNTEQVQALYLEMMEQD